MNFLYPNFLYGLFAVLLPIIVHLFNFQRYKVVYFSNFQFLQNLQMQTKRQSTVKRWLLLLTRILIIVGIVFIFAHPYSPNSSTTKTFASNSVCVFIDNSFSMSDKGDDNTLINKAKESAKQIVTAFSPSDKFILLTNEMNAEQFRTLSREDFLMKLNDVKANTISRGISDISLKINDYLSGIKQSNKKVFIISDFQKSSFDLRNISFDSTCNVRLVHLPHSSLNNLAIDSCWFEEPIFRQNQHLSLFVQVRNYSSVPYENIPLSIKINGKEKATALCNISSNGSAIIPLNFSISEIGVMHGEIEVNDPGEIDFDNSFYVSFKIESQVNVLEVYQYTPNPFIKAIYSTDSIFQFTSQPINSVKYEEWPKYQLIILSQPEKIASGTVSELIKYVNGGGAIAFTPPSVPVMDTSIIDFFKRECNVEFEIIDTTNLQVQQINNMHPLFNQVFDGSLTGVEFPIANRHYTVRDVGGSFQELFRLQNSDCVFGVTRLNQGMVYVFGIAPDDYFGNFSQHPIIVPTFLNMAYTQSQNRKLYYYIQNQEVVRIRNLEIQGDQVLKFRSLDKKTEIIPQFIAASGEVQLVEHNQLNHPGNYEIIRDDGPVEGVSFNYSSLESDMSFFSNENLEELIAQQKMSNIKIQDYKQMVSQADIYSDSTQSLHKWLIFLVLLLVLVEIAIIKLWK